MNTQSVTFNPLGIIFFIIFLILMTNLVYLCYFKPFNIYTTQKTTLNVWYTVICIFIIVISFIIYTEFNIT